MHIPRKKGERELELWKQEIVIFKEKMEKLIGFKSLEDYVTEKTLALEEERIRKDPAARSSELLKKIFSQT